MGKYYKNIDSLVRYAKDPEFREQERIRHNEGIDRRRWIGKFIFLPFMAVMLYFLLKAQFHF
jgi:hypothetical protein